MKQRFKVQVVSSLQELMQGLSLSVLKPQKPFEDEDILPACSTAAKVNSTYLVTAPYSLGGNLCLSLFSPGGLLLGTQKAIHLNTRLTGFVQSTELALINTELGKIMLCVDVDIYHPEVQRAAKAMGGNLVISSQYFYEGDYRQEQILFGAWSEAQANHLCVINANNYTASVIVPSHTVEEKGFTGFLADVTTQNIIETIDYADIEKAYGAFPIFDTRNFPLYQRHRQQLTGGKADEV